MPVILKIGTKPGPKRAHFLIEFDSTAASPLMLELVADLVSPGECRPIELASRSQQTKGESRRCRWIATTWRSSSDEPAAPVTLTASEPIRADFRGPPRVQQFAGGLTRFDREIDVTLPASRSSGHFRAELLVGCEDGTSIKELVTWEVEETFRVVPSGLVLFKQEAPSIKSFHLECSDRPFRVLGIVNPLSDHTSPPNDDDSRHSRTVRVELDPSRAEPDKRYDIVLKTDHPDRPEVAISILVLDHGQGEGR